MMVVNGINIIYLVDSILGVPGSSNKTFVTGLFTTSFALEDCIRRFQ